MRLTAPASPKNNDQNSLHRADCIDIECMWESRDSTVIASPLK
jgi:hypothetical protein